MNKDKTKWLRNGALSVVPFALLANASADNLTWNVVDGTWDTVTANWTGDDTLFDDSGVDNVTFNNAGGGIVTVVQGMSPLSITVDSAGQYKFITGVTPQGQTGSIDSGDLIKNGAGELQLGDDALGQQFGGSANVYSNGFTSITVNGGSLQYNSIPGLGAGTITMAGGTSLRQERVEGRYKFGNEGTNNDIVLSGGAVQIDFDAKGTWLNGDISGAGSLLFNEGQGRTAALSGVNTFTGGVELANISEVLIGTYSAFGTGTITGNQNFKTNYGAALIAGEFLDGVAADYKSEIDASGVSNDIVILSGRSIGVACGTSGNLGSPGHLWLSGDISGDGSLVRTRPLRGTGEGVVRLTGACTHTGGTWVASDTLTIDGTMASANIVITAGESWGGPVSNSEIIPGKLNGSGTITYNINGATSDLIQVLGYFHADTGHLPCTLDITSLNIDFNASGLTEPVYVLVDKAVDGEQEGTIVGATFASVSNLPAGYVIDYSYDSGNQIALVQTGGAAPYDTWTGTFGGLSNTDPTVDFDLGSLETGLEWVLAGDPTDPTDDLSIAPTLDNTTDPSYLIFTYRRSDEANGDGNTTITVNYGSDLSSWTAAVHDGSDIIITESDDAIATGIDSVEVKIAKSLAVGGRLFVNLDVDVVVP